MSAPDAAPLVETARGPVAADALGRVLMHEHIVLANPEWIANYRPDFDEAAVVADAAARLNALKGHGIDTIVDLTVLGLGRFVPRIARIAALTGVNIVVATGAYTFDETPHGFAYWGPGCLVPTEVDPMIELFARDIEQGIAGTNVKAGALKCAIDRPGLTKGVERVMRAVAQTHRRTGVPISVHTAPHEQTGLIVQRVLAEEGVNLEDVIIGHSGDTGDVDYLMRLADKGSILGMDRFGVSFAISSADRVRTVAEMARRGYADRMVLSHDCACFSDHFPDNAMYGEYMPDHHYLHLSRDVLPALLEAGVSQAQIDAMFIDNPRRHFSASLSRQG